MWGPTRNRHACLLHAGFFFTFYFILQFFPKWLSGKHLHHFGKVLFGVGPSCQILELHFTVVYPELGSML